MVTFKKKHSKPHSKKYSKPHSKPHSKQHSKQHSKPHSKKYSKPHSKPYSKLHSKPYSKPHSKPHSKKHSKKHFKTQLTNYQTIRGGNPEVPPQIPQIPQEPQEVGQNQQELEKSFKDVKENGIALAKSSITLASQIIRIIRENTILIQYLIKGDKGSRNAFTTEIIRLLSNGDPELISILQNNKEFEKDIDTLFIKIHEKLKSGLYSLLTMIISIVPAAGPAVTLIMHIIKTTIESRNLFESTQTILELRNSIAKK